MTHDSVKHFEKVLQILEICGNVSGTYLPDLKTSTPNCFTRFKKFYVGLVIVVVSFLVVCCVSYVLDNRENTSVIPQSLTAGVAVLQYIIKFVLFIYYKSDIFDLVQKAKCFRSVNITSEEEEHISEKSTKRSLHAALVFLFTYSTIPITSAIGPLIQEDKLLPLAVQIPFVPPFESPFLIINYVYQVLATFYATTSLAVLDAVYVVLINEGCLQLDIIAEKLSHIGEDSEGAENEEDDLKLLREIHVLHMSVNRYFYKINKIFSLMLLVQFFTSTYGISFGIFCNVKTLQTENICALVAYSFQIFAFTFYGEQTKIKMANMLQALYINKWYNLGAATRKSLMIMMSCSQPQYQLSAGGFIDLTLKTFLAIMKTAYSYYALMNST